MIIKPKGSILAYLSARSCGNNPIRILEPSKGGMGIRLKTPKIILIKMRFLSTKSQVTDKGKILQSRLKIRAKIKLAAGSNKKHQGQDNRP